MVEFNYLKPFKFFCQKVLPLVYDDSLSYYEVLCKMRDKLNEVIEDVNKIPEYIQEYISEDVLKEIISAIMNELRANIERDNEHDSPTATKDYETGDVLWWKDELYNVLRPIQIGDAFIDYSENPNIVHITVEEQIENLVGDIIEVNEDIADILLTIGDEDSGLIKAINDNASAIDALEGVVGDSEGGLVKDVNDLQNVVGDSNSGLVHDVIELQEEIQYAGYIITPEEFGAIGDGVTDDTEAVQTALNQGGLIYFAKEYLIHADPDISWHHGLDVKSNTTIFGHGTIKLAPNAYGNYSVLHVYKRENVIIQGITVVGERSAHTGATGEWGMGIGVGSSNNVRIENVTIKDCWGDGLYLGKLSEEALTDNTNVKVIGCTITNNRRNNISMIHVSDVVIDGCTITDANGTSPEAGIDIEPDTGMGVHNVVITNCYFEGNQHAAVGINHFTANDVTGIVVNDNVFVDQYVGGYVTGGVTQQSLPVFESNAFVAMTNTVLVSQAFSCNFSDNEIACVAYSDSPAIQMHGVSGCIKNNNIAWYTTGAYIIEEGGSFNNIEGNTFMGSCVSRVIYAGGQYCQIRNNAIQTMTTATGFVLMDAANLIISHNDWATIHTPAYFVVVGTNFTQGTESICFNRVAFSSGFVNTGTVNKAANVENGTFVA